MRAFLSILSILALIVYATYFFSINTDILVDPRTKMLILLLWRDWTALSAWDLERVAILARPAEVVLFVAVGACLLGWLIGWRIGRQGLREQRLALQRAEGELQKTRRQVEQLQNQLLEAYRQHEARLTELTERLLTVTKAVLPTTEVQVESLPLPEAPALPRQEETPPERPEGKEGEGG